MLWYVAAMARELGVPLSEVAEWNISKLSSRADRGVIGGSGSVYMHPGTDGQPFLSDALVVVTRKYV